MIGLGMPKSQRPSASCRNRLRHAGDDRHARRIGEGKPDDDRADAERRDHRVHSKFRDDEAIDDADQRAEREHDGDSEPDWAACRGR